MNAPCPHGNRFYCGTCRATTGRHPREQSRAYRGPAASPEGPPLLIELPVAAARDLYAASLAHQTAAERKVLGYVTRALAARAVAEIKASAPPVRERDIPCIGCGEPTPTGYCGHPRNFCQNDPRVTETEAR